MAQSDVDISNNALLLLGDDVITLMTDGTKRANLANAMLGSVKESVLRSHPWNCAIKRASLTVTTAPVFGWTAAFALPADCLRVLSLNDDQEDGDSGDVFKIESKLLLANQGTAKIKYIRNISDYADFDPLLYQAIIFRMASAMAYPITGSMNVSQEMWALYTKVLQEARSIDGQEGSADRIVNTTLTEIR